MALFNNLKVFIFVLLLTAFIGFLVAGLQSESFGPKSQPVVRQFPTVQMELLDGTSLSNARSLFTEDYQLINVWASWCGVCKAEHPFLNQLAKQGVPIIGINYRDQTSSAHNYLGHGGNPYQQVIIDPKGKLGIELGVVGTPETYVVTKAGEIVYKHFGMLNQAAWDKHLAKYFEDKV
ncbi:DsbE family thiol:disulfide interchange protein [Vibrio atypicus]|uniref:DsbE family thiol:disulfide interchange protein n=1 Tax=Vibrio atypicus TaxID=558271 RepID=UPI003735A268